MILIQDYLGSFQIQLVFGAFFPRHIKDPIDIGTNNSSFRRIGMHHIHALNLLFGLFTHLFRHFGFFELAQQIIYLLPPLITIAKFFLQCMELFAQVIFTLGF